MIVPSSRLLFWVGAVVLPFALLAAVAPDAALVSLLFIAGFFLMAVVAFVLYNDITKIIS